MNLAGTNPTILKTSEYQEMELKTQAVYVAALLACSLIASSEAITCYQCSSASDELCYHLVITDRMRYCTGNLCTKETMKSLGIIHVVRGCSYETWTKEDCVENSDDYLKRKKCVCRSDYCNGERSTLVRNSVTVGFPSAWLLAVVGVLSMSAAIRN